MNISLGYTCVHRACSWLILLQDILQANCIDKKGCRDCDLVRYTIMDPFMLLLLVCTCII